MVGSSSPAAHGQISGQYRRDMAEAIERMGHPATGALLPTPTSGEAAMPSTAAYSARRQENGKQLTIGQTLQLLPTPMTNEAEHYAVNSDGQAGKYLSSMARRGELLNTPSVADGTGGHESRGGERGDELLLPGQAKQMATSWGPYEPAIRRWEAVIGRAAPSPTMTSRSGNQQLSAEFASWMMGLPAGWITEVPGVTRVEALKAAGNGVVPQQCAAALRHMLGQLP